MTQTIRWAIAIALAVLAGFSAWYWTQQYKDDLKASRFLKLKDNVALIRNETVVTDDMIEIAELPEKFSDDFKGLVIPAAPRTFRTAILGRRSVSDVTAGSLLFFQYFEPEKSSDLSDEIQPGNRALTVSVNAENTVGFFVRPGSRVDLVGTFLEPTDRDIGNERFNIKTQVILENVKVLAVGSARNFTEYQRLRGSSYNTATLELTPEQVNIVTFAQQQLSAPLTMVLRRSDEPSQEQPEAPVTWERFSQANSQQEATNDE